MSPSQAFDEQLADAFILRSKNLRAVDGFQGRHDEGSLEALFGRRIGLRHVKQFASAVAVQWHSTTSRSSDANWE